MSTFKRFARVFALWLEDVSKLFGTSSEQHRVVFLFPGQCSVPEIKAAGVCRHVCFCACGKTLECNRSGGAPLSLQTCKKIVFRWFLGSTFSALAERFPSAFGFCSQPGSAQQLASGHAQLRRRSSQHLFRPDL